MRDLLIVLTVLNTLPLILVRPYIGILIWCWISYMNPHRLAWGFAYDLPLAMAVGATTLIAVVLSREAKRLPMHMATILLIILTIWVSFTTVVAILPDAAFVKWDQSMKILLMTFVTMVLINNRERLHALIWMIVVSLGFYGIKGGIFTLISGGGSRVWGPSDSFIADNNALALALIMTVPLMRYLSLHSGVQWVRWGLNGAMLATCIAVIGSHSRGAFVAGIAMLLFLLAKSRQRLLVGIAGVVVVAFAVLMAPDHWIERMESIKHYEEDPSAQGRFQAWTFAFKLALDRPFTGGGFRVNRHRELFFSYVPEADTQRAFHSNYFEVLGEHGFPGLVIFLSLLLATYTCATSLIREHRKKPDTEWAADLGAMCQVSLVGYMVCGLFLNLAFYDLFYHLVAILVIAKAVADKESKPEAAVEAPEVVPRPSTVSIASRAAKRADGPVADRP